MANPDDYTVSIEGSEVVIKREGKGPTSRDRAPQTVRLEPWQVMPRHLQEKLDSLGIETIHRQLPNNRIELMPTRAESL